MTPNPIIERRYGLFRSARVILNEDFFRKLVHKRTFFFIVGILQNDIGDIPHVVKKRKQTVNISLSRSPEEILQSFHDTTRNEIRRTFRMPELTVTQDDNGFGEAFRLYTMFRRAKGLPLKHKSFLRQATRLSAYWKGKLVAVVTCYDVPPYMRIQNIFSEVTDNDEMRKIAGFATRRLIYELCAYGSREKRVFLDMASINLHNPAKQGITRFKQSFGGEIVNEYTYTYKSPFIRLLNTIVRSVL